jgi:hypothetical protein
MDIRIVINDFSRMNYIFMNKTLNGVTKEGKIGGGNIGGAPRKVKRGMSTMNERI